MQAPSSQNTEFELDSRGDIQPVQSIVDCGRNAAPSRQLEYDASGGSHHSVQLRDNESSCSTQQTVTIVQPREDEGANQRMTRVDRK